MGENFPFFWVTIAFCVAIVIYAWAELNKMCSSHTKLNAIIRWASNSLVYADVY